MRFLSVALLPYTLLAPHFLLPSLLTDRARWLLCLERGARQQATCACCVISLLNDAGGALLLLPRASLRQRGASPFRCLPCLAYLPGCLAAARHAAGMALKATSSRNCASVPAFGDSYGRRLVGAAAGALGALGRRGERLRAAPASPRDCLSLPGFYLALLRQRPLALSRGLGRSGAGVTPVLLYRGKL